MKFFALSNILPALSLCLLAIVSASPSSSGTDYTKYNYLLESIRGLSSDFDKRDDSQIAQFTALFKAFGSSSLIPDIIEDITSSETKMQNLANITTGLVGAIEGGNATFEGINIKLNFTEILNSVLSSGLIQSTATGLLLNNTNNAILADYVGGILGNPDNVWIGWLLMGLGEGHALTVPYLADLIVNSTSKANTNTTEQSQIKGVNFKQEDNVVFDKKEVENGDKIFDSLDDYLSNVLNARDDNSNNDDNQYAGSFNTFLGNIINTVASSSLVGGSVDDIIIALNNSGIVVPLVMEIIENANLGSLTKIVVGTLYKSGLLDNISINPYYQYAKKQGILSDSLQYILTDPTYSPGLATLFKRMDDSGAYQRLQDNMYGVKK